MQVFILLALSIPFFYILGIIQLISWLNKANPKKKELLKRLKEEARKNPQKTLKEYLKELEVSPSFESEDSQDKAFNEKVHQELENQKADGSKSALVSDVSNLWNNWYSNNSINLLLYLGAFLIVAAASIFVGFQWNTFPGTAKAIFLSLLAVSFFASGLWFHSAPKIKNAGTTFIGIGSLLVPICGAGWYNFVLRDAGISTGMTWFATSIISLLLYAYLSYKFKNSFYVYTSSLASISLALAFVNMAGLNKEAYILASLLGSFALLLVSIIFKRSKKSDAEKIGLPVEISANVVMPISLAGGLFLTLQSNSLYTFEASAGVLIAAAFYLTSYLSNRNSNFLLVSQALLPAGIFLLFHWLKISDPYLLYTLDAIAMGYLYVAFLLKTDNLKGESDSNLASSTLLSLLVFALSFLFKLSHLEQFIFACIPILSGAALAYIKNNINLAYLSTLFVLIATWELAHNVFGLSFAHSYYFSYILAVMACGMFVVSVDKKEILKIRDFLLTNIGFYFVLAGIASINNLTVESVLAGTVAVLFLLARIVWKEPKLLIGFAVAVFASVLFLLFARHIETFYFPLILTALAAAFYGFSFIVRPDDSEELKNIGLTAQFAVAAFSLSTSIFTYGSINQQLRFNALLTGYATTALFFVDSYIRNKPNFDYLTSFFALAIYLWQISYWQFTETLFYNVPIGIYFLILGYLRSLHKDNSTSDLLDTVGSLVLLTPIFYFSFSKGAFYTLFLILLSIVLLTLGITLQNKIYRYIGSGGIILAILPHTYQFILSLPKWVIVGVVGLAFISIAIFLLLKREEKE